MTGAHQGWDPSDPPRDEPSAHPAARRRTLMVLGIAGATLLAVVVIVVAGVTFARMGRHTPTAAPAAGPPPSTAAPTVARCIAGVPIADVPKTDMVAAGGLSFPRDVAPDWEIERDQITPNSTDAVSLQTTISTSGDMMWTEGMTVGVTTFDQSMSLANQARSMLKCAVPEMYSGQSPTVGAVRSTPGRLDGVATETIEVRVSVVTWDPTIKGDDLTLVIVGTRPTTYFLATTVFGDVNARKVVQAARDRLHVSGL